MPRVAYDGFVGPSSTQRSYNVNMERSINWRPEITSPGRPKANPAMPPTPGLSPFVILDDSPVRGLFALNGRCWGVGGSFFSEIFDDGSYTNRGLVSTTGISGGVGDSVSICSNGTAGNQLFITAGGHGYTYDLGTDVLTEITDADFLTPTYMGCFIDGYFISLKALTRTFQISALEDGTSWDGLDVYEVSRTADNLVSMVASHGQLVLFGSKTFDIWANNGNPTTPFAPTTGGYGEVGAAAPFATVTLDNTVFWLGTNEYGDGIVYRLDGYTPKRISDGPTEVWIAGAARIDNAIAWTYQQDGCAFYVLYVPELNTTRVYEVTTNLWHEIAHWVPPNTEDVDFRAHVGRCHAFAFNPGVHLVGDRQSGAVYEMAPTFTADDLVIGSGL